MNFTVGELMDFLARAKGNLLNSNTARTRRTAVKQVFSINEGEDWRRIVINENTIDLFLSRFSKSGRANHLSNSSLNTYRSRIRSSVEDYSGWLNSGDSYFSKDDVVQIETKIKSASWKIPVPLREGVVVTIEGLPTDLSLEERDRIIRIIDAYTKDEN